MLLEDTTISQLINGWNEKLQYDNPQLSQMIPFVELFSILPEKTDNPKTKQDIQKSLSITIKEDSDDSGKQINILPVFTLLDQQTKTVNNINIFNRGISGIESMRVDYLNAENFSYSVTMELSIPTLYRDIETNNALRKLITLNSDWIIAYGWSKKNSDIYSFFNQDKTKQKIINLSKSNRGFSKILRATLLRFDFEAQYNKETKVSLLFGAQAPNILSLYNISNSRDNILNLLNPNSGKTNILSKVNYKDIGLPNSTGINITAYIDIRNGDGNKQSKLTVGKFYYLGWILESLRFSLSNTEKPAFEKIIFKPFTYAIPYQIQIEENSLSKPIDKYAKNPGEILIHKNLIENYFLNSNDSLFTAINEILRIASNKLGTELSYTVNKSGNSITIIDLNQEFKDNLERTHLEMVLSSQKSLIQNIQFTGDIPKELTFALDIFLNSDQGLTTIFNVGKELLQNEKKNGKPLSYLSQITDDFIIQNFENEQNKKITTPLELHRFRTYLNNDSIQIDKIFDSLLNNDSVPIGFALRNYFTKLILTLHGVAGVPFTMPIHFKGFLKGIDGKYIVISAIDDISVGDFHTVLTLVLNEAD